MKSIHVAIVQRIGILVGIVFKSLITHISGSQSSKGHKIRFFQGLAKLLERVKNKFCKVNFKNPISFFFALIFSCKLEISV